MKNGKVIATVVSILVLVGMFFGAFFMLEARFCSSVRAAIAEGKIVDNAEEIEELGRKVERNQIDDYRRRIKALKLEYGSRDNMPEDVKKYYDWLRSELTRLIESQMNKTADPDQE